MSVFQQTLLDLERTQQVVKKQLRVFHPYKQCAYRINIFCLDMRKK